MAATHYHASPHAQGVLHVTRMRAVTGNGAVAFTVLLLVVVLTTPAAAVTGKRGSATPPGQARFEGHQINLQRGWGDARACVVWNTDGETDCFRTEQAADAAIQRRERAEARDATLRPAAWPASWRLDRRVADTVPPVAWASVCSSWLYLYEHVDHAGRSLRFRDLGTTQDLATWGFSSQTSSYRVGACGVLLRDGGGIVYPGSTSAHATATRMLSGWNDRVRYLRIG